MSIRVFGLGFLKFLKRDKSKEMNLGLNGMSEFDVPPPPPDMEFGMKAGQIPKFPNMAVKGSAQEDSFPDLPELPELPDLPEEAPLPAIEEQQPFSFQNDFSKSKSKMPGADIGVKEETADFGEDIGMPGPQGLPPLEDLPPLDEAASRGREEMLMQQKRPEMPSFPQQRPLFVQAPRPFFGRRYPHPIVESFPKPSSVGKASAYQRTESKAFEQEKGMLGHKRSKGPIFVRVERFKGIIGSASLIKNSLKTAEQTASKLSEIDESRERAFEKWQGIMLDLQKKFLFIDKTLFKGDKK